MPYIIAVLTFVVIGVGFTLFNDQTQTLVSVDKNELPIEEPLDTEVADSVSTFKDDIEELIAESYESASNTVIKIKDEVIPSATTVTNTSAPKPTPAVVTPTPEPTPIVVTPTPVATTEFKNGTYSSQVNYRTPDGTYQMIVSLTIANDTATNSSVTFDSKGARDSYSKRFLKSYASQVNGNDVASIRLSRVGGASLTSNAFNNAINNIEKQAAS